jgi:protein TonB
MLGSNIDIFRTEWLNVVFADRNRSYGAYELRRDNTRNTIKALLIAISVFIFVLATPTIYNKVMGFIPKADPHYKTIPVELLPPPVLEKPKVQPVLPHEAPRPHTTEVRFPPPVVRPDPDVHEQDPPTDDELQKVNPGLQNLKGDDKAPIDIDENHGTAERDKGITEAESNVPFTAVEIPPEYPGGEAAFGKFLVKNIKYPPVARENGVQGKVYVQFIVERDGSLTDVKVIREPGSGTGDEAVRVLKMSPHWRAGIQNGKAVRVQFTVPVSFSLGEQ